MSAKHTPGPWLFDGEYVWAEAIKGYIANPNTEDMRSGDSVPLRKADDMICANGRLIAAAPDLLDALQDMVDAWGSGYEFDESPSLDKARAVLLKAKGGHQ